MTVLPNLADCPDLNDTPNFAALILGALFDIKDEIHQLKEVIMTEATQIQSATDAVNALATEIGNIDTAFEAFIAANPGADFSGLNTALASAKTVADKALADVAAASAPVAPPVVTPEPVATDTPAPTDPTDPTVVPPADPTALVDAPADTDPAASSTDPAPSTS